MSVRTTQPRPKSVAGPSRLLGIPMWLALLFTASAAVAEAQDTATTRTFPRIAKLGTVDCDMVEVTPVVFRGELYRFESVRVGYRHNQLGRPYFRFLHVSSGRPTPPFALGHDLGCAYVDDSSEKPRIYVFGVAGWGTDTIRVFWSDDLERWSEAVALQQPNWQLYNTSVCRANNKFVMAIEVGSPPEVAGVPFTTRFAVSDDLRRWELLPEPHVYTKVRYSACPTLRYEQGFYYMFYLESRPGPTYETHLVRSRDLIQWQSSPYNPVLRHSDEDRRIANDRLTQQERDRIARAVNVNNSDFDLCEFQNKVVMYYSWGNQQGVEHLAQAEYTGTIKDFLLGYFK